MRAAGKNIFLVLFMISLPSFFKLAVMRFDDEENFHPAGGPETFFLRVGLILSLEFKSVFIC